MKAENRTTDPAPQTSPETPAARKRFRIQKLEERIAPKKGGKGTHNCSGSGTSSGFSSASIF